MPQKMIQGIYHFHSKEGNNMNKIYKVIWSKAKHTYVVASEIAKGHTKGETTGKGLKKLAAAMLVAAALLSPSFAWAADATTKFEPAADQASNTAVAVYTKDEADNKFATIDNLSFVSTEVHTQATQVKTNAEQINTNTTNIKELTTKVTALETADKNSVTEVIGSDAKLTITKGDGSTSEVTIDNVNHATSADSATTAESATKATQDGNGNKISTTYATKTEVKEADEKLDSRITAVKEFLQTETENRYVSKDSLASELEVKAAGVVKEDQTIGENVTDLGSALYKETADRLGADQKQDQKIDYNYAMINQTNKNMADGFNAINKNVVDGFTALNQADAAEKEARKTADTELNERITNEANAIHDEIKAGDTALDTRITNVKEYVLSETVSKTDAAVQDGAIVKAANTIGENVTNLDAALAKETAARIGADKAQDKVIQQVNQNMVEGFNTINKNMFDGFTALNQADAKEAQKRAAADAALDDKITAETSARVAADTKLVKAMNSGLSLSEDNVLQKDTTTIDAQGNVTPSKTDANEMILNKGDNQITLNEKGIKVGTNSSVMDKNGVYTGGDTYSEAKAALKSDGSIKGADGKFTVNSANGTVNVNNQIELNGATGVVISNSLNVGNGNFTVNTDGNVATKGSLSAADGKFTVTTDGGVSAAGGKAVINSDGKITAASVDAGSGTIQTTGTIQGGTITDGTASLSEGNLTGLESVETKELKTTGDAEIGGSLTVNQDLTVKGKFNADTLNSREDKNNYTTISGGNVTSKNLVMSDEGNIEASYSNLDETGSDVWARDDDSKGSSTVTADSVKQSISDVGDNAKNYASRELSQNTDNKYEITDSVVRGNQSNVENRTADTTDSQISLKDDSGKVLNKSYITQNLKKVLMGVEEGNNKTTIEQDANNITNTAENGTITNIAKDLVNTASENMTNNVGKDLTTTVGGEMKTTVTGDVTEDYKSNLSTTVGRNQTTTVTGDSSLTAENINNEAKNKIINKALDVETDAKSSIVNKVSNEYGSNTSTQLSYETKEKMSQADGKTASYLRGAAEEKSQLTDGDKKTTIDTIAGQTNTNITDGTNTSNNLQKADQVASSVKNGDNQTVSNQDAESLASSATDGTNTTVANQNAKSFSSAATDGTNTSVVSQDAKSINSAVTDGTNSTGIRQDAQNIALSANNGTIAASAKNITNTASETLSNSAKNINNTATDKLSNSAADIENKASKSILNQVGEKTSWTMTDGKVLESIKGADGQTNTITDTADSTVQNVKNGKNELTSTTSSTNADLTITNGSSAYTKVNTATGNKETVKEGENLASTNLTKNGFNVYAQDENGHNTIINNASGTTQTIQTDDEHLNVTTKTVGTSEEKLTSGKSVIDVLKSFDDKGNPAATSSVTDGTNTSEVKQTAKDITNTAEGGTIYNKSKDILNEASGDIINFADGEIGNTATKITNITGDNTVTSDTNGTTFENKAHSTAIEEGTVTKTTISGNTLETGKATMDYADVMKDLGVRGNATVDGNTTLGKEGAETTLTVNSTSTFKEKVTMEKDLNVKSEVLVNEGEVNQVRINNDGITVGLGSTLINYEGVYVGGHSFDEAKAAMGADGRLKAANGNFQVDTEGNVSAVSYTVKDTTIKIDKDGINAGGKVIKNVGQGDISNANSTDAVSGGQLYETNTRVSGLETRMGTVETKVDKLDNKIDKVGANAAAMANLHPLEFDEDSKWNIAAAVGSSGSETASAVGVFYRPNENVMVNASAAMGTGENMFGGGVSLRLGHGGNKAKEAQMKAAAKENRELRAKVDDLTARMDALLSVLNPNMSKDFPDVPENHWAYEAVSRLAGNGIVEGYEDGKYHGERQMTRYEMAEIIYNALSKGAKAEKKLVEEFRPELQAMAAQKKA